jgi:hypothetical protein
MPILRDKNYQQLNDRIRSFTVLSWYCKTFIDDAHALFRDSDYTTVFFFWFSSFFQLYFTISQNYFVILTFNRDKK